MGRRWVRVLAVTVVVLAVLFVTADRVAVHVADKEVLRLAQEKYGYANTTDGHMSVAIQGFPFVTQAIGGDFRHVTLTAEKFFIDTTDNRQGGYLDIARLSLDLRGVSVTSLTARSAQADLATGTLTLSYDDLSGVVTRLARAGGPLRVSRAPGSDGQEARLRVSGTVGGTPLNGTGTLLAQGSELTLTVPGAPDAGCAWKMSLPVGLGFTAARATADGIEISLVGHQVTLGSSRFDA
ncbi:DUF2993 domain-containing protein [Streptomyces sp. NPDC088354]|uniref:LmeA family phospholipid-binding protein n=1 Tax=Streptomyces sp. NPDC088354 TaxID=3365856 RepID=UPI00381DCDA1